MVEVAPLVECPRDLSDLWGDAVEYGGGAPTGTRTQTVRILSPLPLPIGLWGPRLIVETSIPVPNVSL